MEAAAPQAGFFLSLTTESFVVRALLGSALAAAVAAAALRLRVPRSRGARTLLLLGPVVTALAAAVASYGNTFLPQLWVTSAGGRAGVMLQLPGDVRRISPTLLLAGLWALLAALLLLRRLAGALRIRRLLARARPAPAGSPVVALAARLTAAMGVRRVRLLLLDGCPGGAFACGVRHPVVAVDPALLDHLDLAETEGLVSHELAHVARRDPLVVTLVGVVSDLAHFLPTVALARRWLRREQEEGADELAASHTGRPAALASGILKVWDHAGRAPSPIGVCAAVPRQPAIVAMPGARARVACGVSPQASCRVSPGVATMAIRVSRLVEPGPTVGASRRAAELLVAAALVCAATAAALIVPGEVAERLDAEAFSLAFVPPPEVPVESPAFATFRALAPHPPASLRAAEWRTSPRSDAAWRSPVPAGCPCVQTRAELVAGQPASTEVVVPAMSWRSGDRLDWAAAGGQPLPARPLWTLRESGPEVGLFVVGGAGAR